MIKHTKRGWRKDQMERSKQKWERGRGAKRIGNPRYMRAMRKGRMVFVLRR